MPRISLNEARQQIGPFVPVVPGPAARKDHNELHALVFGHNRRVPLTRAVKFEVGTVGSELRWKVPESRRSVIPALFADDHDQVDRGRSAMHLVCDPELEVWLGRHTMQCIHWDNSTRLDRLKSIKLSSV